MNYRNQENLRLFARNEGKLKSYESCRDIRAWSHDVSVKDRYLREWMKSDMPISVLPISTLTGFLRTMTCKSRRKVAPRCHPDCKSKVLLESICTSCHAMRECLKRDDYFDKYFVKYFVEEDLETSHWPCEKCLEALKSIKMFWKIIVDKIFNINISKCSNLETNCVSGDNVRSVAKTWQAEIVQQSFYVKNISPVLNRLPLLRGCSPTTPKKKEPNELSEHNTRGASVDKSISKQISKIKGKTSIVRTEDHKGEINSNMRKRISRSTNVDIKHCDVGCGTCFIEKVQDEITVYKRDIQVLQNKCNDHMEEVDKLKRENNSLMIELENVYKKNAFHCPESHKRHTLVPKPFDTALEDSSLDPAKDIDSQIVITMKKCKNKDYNHVSLLQVLHKSNQPTNTDFKDGPLVDKDPIKILTKVQNKFGAIVDREMKVVNDQRRRATKQSSDIEASHHKVNVSKSTPSCSTLSSRLSSDVNFASAKENTS